MVVNETYTLMMYRSKGNLNQLQFLDNLFWGEERFFKIVYFNKPDFQNIAQTMKKYSSPKKMLSFVDASLIYLASQLKISQIVSFDAHFDGILNRIFEISL
ncbi:MAG: type II toxin-antitoxin system VapC family toxin [Promethearchaeota archaeon]